MAETSDDEWLSDRTRYLLEVPAAQLADTVTRVLDAEGERVALVERSQRLIQNELSMSNCLGRVVEGVN